MGGKRRVYMTYFLQRGWYCQFLEEDCRTPLPTKFTFRDVGKVIQLAERAGALTNLEARQAIEHAISTGRGGMWLDGEKTQQSAKSLARIWGVAPQDAVTRAEQLVEAGFFERKGTKDEPVFWVPFLYRDALNMVPGPAS